jgi:hypothetical protein
MTSIGIISSVMLWFDVASKLASFVLEGREEEFSELAGGMMVSWSQGIGKRVTRGFSARIFRTTLVKSTSPSGGF